MIPQGSVASEDRASPREAQAIEGMVWIEGGTFRMGSDRHYPEEPPRIACGWTGFGSTGRL